MDDDTADKQQPLDFEPKFKGGAGGRVVIKGSLDITLADGTVEKRPFVSSIPLSELQEKLNG